MANEYFKQTQIFERFRKGLRQYPFSLCDFVVTNPGSSDTLIGSGMVSDGEAIYKTIPLSDEHDTPEIQLNAQIDPSFVYDESVVTGMREVM